MRVRRAGGGKVVDIKFCASPDQEGINLRVSGTALSQWGVVFRAYCKCQSVLSLFDKMCVRPAPVVDLSDMSCHLPIVAEP